MTSPAPALIHRRSNDRTRTQALGPYHIESLLDRHEEAAGTVYRVHVAARQKTSVSYHRVAEEYYFVLAGSGTALLDGREYPLQTGDFLRLPPSTTHGFTAGEEGLDLLDIHTPGCRPDHDVYFVDATPEGFG
jgi:mannose-6-phosphate isomerase-like protein (cupin superfamily)